MKTQNAFRLFLMFTICLINISKTIQQDPLKYSIYYHSDTNTYEVKPGIDRKDNAVADAVYYSSFLSQGWDKLYLTTRAGNDDKIQAYAAGYLEGAITTNQIFNHYMNTFTETWKDNNGQVTENVLNFLQQQDAYVRNLIQNYNPDSPYDKAMLNVYTQFRGLMDGYNNNTENKKLSLVDFHTMNAFGDLSDIKQYKNPTDFDNQPEEFFYKYIRDSSHCTAFIKMKEDYTDLWFGHNSWWNYTFMTRIMKTYTFNYNSKTQSSTFSSYPATLSSVDDFYVLSSNLVVIETTNPVYNNKLFDLLTPNSLLCWHRTLIANLVAVGAQDWVNNFALKNSGTYNNQFMVLDLNKIDTSKGKVHDQALMIIEQIPGYTEINDVTGFLRMGYWPSYNSPFSVEIRNRSKSTYFMNKFPSLKGTLDYDTNARANIFRRDAGGVNDIEKFKKFMRYNQWKTDPLSLGDSSFSIASRYDLETDPTKIGCHGALDAKISSIKDVLVNGKIQIIAGPTNQDIEAFDWTNSKACTGISHTGLPNNYIYTWLDFPLTTPVN